MSSLRDRYSFIIFDWDGTLMDSTARIVSSMQTAAYQARLPVPSVDAVKSIIGLSLDAVMDILFPQTGDANRKELIETYRYQYIEADLTPTPLFEGTLALLDWLKSQQIPIAIATGKARFGLDRVLEEVGLVDFFDYSICADEAQSKPHPQMVNKLLQRARKQPEQSLLLGDSVHDLKMACNARVDSVGVTSGASSFDELNQHQPVAILEKICHLQRWLSD